MMGKWGVKKLVSSILPAIILSLVLGVSVTMAATISSSNYSIDGNLGGSFGGQLSSTNYAMTTIGGEAIVGSGQSGSYIIDQQPTNSVTPTMQLSVQPSGLVAYYPLDETSGTTLADASQYQHDGTLNSPATFDASGKLSGAVAMNGPTDSTGSGAVLVSDHANMPTGATMTVEAWVKQTSWVPNQTMVSQWKYSAPQSGSWAISTGPSNNSLRILLADSASDPGNNYVDTATNSWNTFNTWRHVVVTYDGNLSQANKVKVYIDGVQTGTTVTGTLPSTLYNSTGDLSIGSFPGRGWALRGSVDHVKLFNRTLSPAEVNAEHGAQNAGTPAGLTLGTLISGSTTSSADAIVRTNAADYGLSIQQDHNLQSGANTIPAVSGSIASPQTWSEGTTKGLGFTVFGAPTLDSKWASGASYAAIPSSATTFYSTSGHVNGAIDVINVRLRLDIATTQVSGAYNNTVTYTGTTIP